MKNLFVCESENGYIIVVKAKDSSEAEEIANVWFSDNMTSLDLGIEWNIQECDCNEVIK